MLNYCVECRKDDICRAVSVCGCVCVDFVYGIPCRVYFIRVNCEFETPAFGFNVLPRSLLSLHYVSVIDYYCLN